MICVRSKLKKWGNSFGVVIPKDVVKKGELELDQSVEVLILRRTNALKETFGTLKLKKSADEIMRELDEELWNE